MNRLSKIFSNWFSFKTALPKPSGPYNVGTTEVMSGRGEESTLINLYYPTQPDKQLNKNYHPAPWLPEPMTDYAQGLIDFASMKFGSFVRWLFREYQALWT